MNRTQKKHLFLLGGIVAALVIILAVVLAVKRSNAQQAAEEAARQEAESVITQTEASYTALTYDNGTTTLSFHLDEEGQWVWSDDPEFPLDDTTVQSILDLLADLRPQQTITDGDTLDAYGLDQPFATLTATQADGGTLTIALGNTTTDGTIISDALYRYMSETIYDMCDLPELPVLTEDTIQSITVEGTVSTLLRPLGTETDEDTGTETVTWAAGGEDVTELESTGDLLSDLEGISLTKCVDYKPTDEAAELCGFSAPRAVVTVLYLTETGTESSLTLTFGSDNLDGTGCYVRVNDDPTIYQVDSGDADAILSVAASGLTDASASE